MSLNKTDTTRYLCAAAYLSPTFRDSVIQLFKEDYRAIATSHGVDLLTVIKHCLAAQKKELIKDIFLANLFILACIIALLTNSATGFIFPFFPIVLAMVFSNAWDIRYRLMTTTLAKGNFNPNSLKVKLTQNEKLRLDEIAKSQNSNVIVYGGFFPFIGSGFQLDGWSFTVNLKKVKKEIVTTLTPICFEVEELYEYIDNAIREIKLSELTIEDKLCVNGQEIRDNSVLLPDIFGPPSSQVHADYIKQFINKSTGHIRHYKHIQIINRRGELVFSVFLRFIKLDENLFVETNNFVLCPVKNEYYLGDAIDPEINVPKVMPLLIGSIIETVFIWPLSILTVWNKNNGIIDDRLKREQMKRIIRENPNFNYGATTSVRELANPSLYSQYFQQLDQEMYLKIIERQIIDSLCDFLETKNIDISDLNNRRNAIFNNGVIISGGSIKATNLSVGEQARSVLTSPLIPPLMLK